MRQNKSKKKYIVQWICCILAILLVGGMVYQYWYKPKNTYQPQKHTNEELLTLFEENRPLFDEVAQIISRNDRFWNEAKSYKDDPYDTHPWISSPDEKNKMKLFTEEEQAVLHTFFEKIGPYRITLDISGPTKEEMKQEIVLERPGCLRLSISCQMEIDQNDIETFSFIYGYGTENEAEEDMKFYSHHHDVIDLEHKWFGCYWE